MRHNFELAVPHCDTTTVVPLDRPYYSLQSRVVPPGPREIISAQKPVPVQDLIMITASFHTTRSF